MDIKTLQVSLKKERHSVFRAFRQNFKKMHKEGRGGEFCGIFWIWLFSGFCYCYVRKAAQNTRKRVKEFLQMENSTVYADLGYVWSVDADATCLTLSQLGLN